MGSKLTGSQTNQIKLLPPSPLHHYQMDCWAIPHLPLNSYLLRTALKSPLDSPAPKRRGSGMRVGRAGRQAIARKDEIPKSSLLTLYSTREFSGRKTP